jgi:hypothetical protein
MIMLLRVAPLTVNEMSEDTQFLMFPLTEEYLFYTAGNQSKLLSLEE